MFVTNSLVDFRLILRIRADDTTAECPLGDKFGCDADEVASRLLELAAQLHQPVIGIS
jgi:ornithine decarboxylase